MIPDQNRGKHRSHPARHARRVTGVAAAGGAIALFGWFGISSDATASTSSTSTRPLKPAVIGNNAGANTNGTASSRQRRAQNVPATPSTLARPPDTWSGGS